VKKWLLDFFTCSAIFLACLLLFFITPKAAHNRHEKQHNPKHSVKTYTNTQKL